MGDAAAVGVLYMPLTLLLARPLAVYLRLVEREPDATSEGAATREVVVAG